MALSNGFFRVLTPDEELEFREWARTHTTEEHIAKGSIYHPVVRDEWMKMGLKGGLVMITAVVFQETEEDNFIDGCIPQTRQIALSETLNNEFTSLDKLLEYLHNSYSFPRETIRYEINDDELIAADIVNESNYIATPEELKEWKKGKIKLYCMTYIIHPFKTTHITNEELIKLKANPEQAI